MSEKGWGENISGENSGWEITKLQLTLSHKPCFSFIKVEQHISQINIVLFIKLCMYNRSIFLKYSFESQLIYKWRYYRQTIYNQLDIMVSYVDIIGLCHSVGIFEKSVMQPKYQNLGSGLGRYPTHKHALDHSLSWKILVRKKRRSHVHGINNRDTIPGRIH